MADHPLRAILAWPLVLGVGLSGMFVLLMCVVGIAGLLFAPSERRADA